MMAKDTIDWETSHYSDHRRTYQSVVVAWDDITDLLGHEHEGDPEDDERIVAALIASGAPGWVEDAEDFIDPAYQDRYGRQQGPTWGLIGPEEETEDGAEEQV